MSDEKLAATSSLEESENIKKITKTSETASENVVKQCEGNGKPYLFIFVVCNLRIYQANN